MLSNTLLTSVMTTHSTPATAEADRASDTCLRGLHLTLARLAWAALGIVALGLFAIALPARYEQLARLAQEARPLFPNLNLAWTYYAGYALAIEVAVVVVYAGLGALIMWRKSADGLAWFASLTLVTYGVYITPALDTLIAVQPALKLPGSLIQAVGLTCPLLFCYLLPDGRLRLRWTRPLAALWVAYNLAWGLFPDLPFNSADFYYLGPIWGLVYIGWWFTGILALLSRFRRLSSPIQRRQSLWVAVCISLAVFGGTALHLTSIAIESVPEWTTVGTFFVLFVHPHYLLLVLPIPFAIAVSIHRHRLFDIDTLLNRTLVYGSLTLVLAALYGGSVVALQSIFFGAFTGQAAPLIVAASTLAVAALFHPLRARLQRVIDYRLFRQRYDAAQRAADFAATVRDEVDLHRLCERLEGVVEETLQPTCVLTWLNTPVGFAAPFASHQPAQVIAPDDPLVAHLRSEREVIQLDQLALDSPALRDLQACHVALIAPLISQGELIGWLGLGPRAEAQTGYGGDDLRLLATLTMQAAPALRVAQMAAAEKTEAVGRERIEHELRLARDIQQSLMPKDAPALPGWQMATHYRPARIVGGDFYDILTFDDGRLGLIIGDVCGKGVPAALLVGAARIALRGAAHRLREPGPVLARANELLCPGMPEGMFITCLYAILDPANGRLRFANAGHNLPCHHSRTCVAELHATGMMLGILPDRHYDEREIVIAPGDDILFYSDGLVEAHNAQGEMFGGPRLQALMQMDPDGSATLIDRLLAAWAMFGRMDAEQEDDLTLIAVHRLE